APRHREPVHAGRVDEIARLRAERLVVDRVVGAERRRHGRDDPDDVLVHAGSLCGQRSDARSCQHRTGARESLSIAPRTIAGAETAVSVSPDAQTWIRIGQWVDGTGHAGERFGIGDLLIAAIAAGGDAALWSLDEDFARMARLEFVGLHGSP